MATAQETSRPIHYEDIHRDMFLPFGLILFYSYITFQRFLNKIRRVLLLPSPSGESQRHRSGRGPELRLRLQQRHFAPGRRRRGLHQAGRRQSPRRQQQQIQHFLRFHSLR